MVLVFGSINIDFVTRVERFPGPGETVSGISFASYPGGKGANQALACTLAGARTRLVGAVGRDAFADPALSLLGKAGVDLTSVTRVDQATGCATILVAGSGENMIVSVPGANAAADPDSIPDALLSASSTVSLQHELPAAANQALLERARRNGSRVVLNASPWRPLSLDTLCTVDYLVVNEREAAALAATFDWPRSTRELALAAAAAVHDLTIVVTLGKQGALAARGSELLRVQAPDVSVIDTTGAGDAFAGTLIAALDSYARLDEALRRAVAAGSLACTVAGAQPSFPDRKAVDVVLERIALLTARCS
ncbi:MAG TPA: ribokinase [Casimicrobiaceae bacterium]|nr:ribokinase [Casimicrobiaceae bacterium]